MKNRKFRGLRKHGNYWVYGSLIREGENCYIIPDEPVLDKDHNTDVLFFGDREVIRNCQENLVGKPRGVSRLYSTKKRKLMQGMEKMFRW